jgi:hypothetical protein
MHYNEHAHIVTQSQALRGICTSVHHVQEQDVKDTCIWNMNLNTTEIARAMHNMWISWVTHTCQVNFMLSTIKVSGVSSYRMVQDTYRCQETLTQIPRKCTQDRQEKSNHKALGPKDFTHKPHSDFYDPRGTHKFRMVQWLGSHSPKVRDQCGGGALEQQPQF